ncbi:MAG: GNAT family N-acetyltransferase [Alphaproteobacteria bacterium]|jgi:acetyltransferase
MEPSDGVRDLDLEVMVAGGRRLCLRHIRTDDAQALVDMGLRSTPEDLRLRFFSPVRPMVGPLTSLLTEFDRDRHIAVAVYDPAATEEERGILGVVRLILGPGATEGEFALMVRSDQAGRGLGHCLMEHMLGWARARGLTRVRAEIMAENKRMLRLAREFGAVVQPQNQDFRIVHLAIDLSALAAPVIDRRLEPI